MNAPLREPDGRFALMPAPCGTLTAYGQHYRRGEKPCKPCRDARARYRQGLPPYPPRQVEC